MSHASVRPVERNILGHIPAKEESARRPGHVLMGALAAAAVASALTGLTASSGSPAAGAQASTHASLTPAFANPSLLSKAAFVTAADADVPARTPAKVTLPAKPHKVAKAAAPASASVVTTHDRHRVTELAAELRRLRECESGDDYGVASGNGYYGAYQFDLSTWHGLGLPGLPNEASHQLQDVAVTRLEALKGWAPWPVCSYVAGLR